MSPSQFTALTEQTDASVMIQQAIDAIDAKQYSSAGAPLLQASRTLAAAKGGKRTPTDWSVVEPVMPPDAYEVPDQVWYDFTAGVGNVADYEQYAHPYAKAAKSALEGALKLLSTGDAKHAGVVVANVRQYILPMAVNFTNQKRFGSNSRLP